LVQKLRINSHDHYIVLMNIPRTYLSLSLFINKDETLRQNFSKIYA